MKTRPVLLLLGRPDCHLCEDFREQLEAAFPGRFEVREADVDSRPDWRQRFGAVIPVLLDEHGAVLCQTRFDSASLAVAPGRGASRSWPGRRA